MVSIKKKALGFFLMGMLLVTFGIVDCKNRKDPSVDPTVSGKYSDLIIKFDCPNDEKTYGKFKDYGKSTFTKWCGKDIPKPGYWVYATPTWYVWENMK